MKTIFNLLPRGACKISKIQRAMMKIPLKTKGEYWSCAAHSSGKMTSQWRPQIFLNTTSSPCHGQHWYTFYDSEPICRMCLYTTECQNDTIGYQILQIHPITITQLNVCSDKCSLVLYPLCHSQRDSCQLATSFIILY